MKQALQQYLTHISQISELAFDALWDCFEPMELKKHGFFVREGEYAQQIGFLSQGIVRAYFVNQAGKEYNKQFFVGPSIIGAYTSLLTRQPNLIAQQALTPSQIWVASYPEVEALYEQFHDLERLGRKIAEFYFLEKEQKEIEMALLEASERYAIFQARFPSVEAEIPQYHIASYLGISPTQLSRIRRNQAAR